MKLRNIEVSHVLHYDSLNVQLNDDDSGMHILYGPNETGKTTLLNLIIDWLYGGRIAEPVAEYYSSDSLLAGTIENSQGQFVQFGRKKRYSRLELTDRSLSEEELVQVMAGYDRERFTLIFGFDHERLRNGGESLLQSGGHAGVSLFEAGGGIQHLHNRLTHLDSRARELLDPSFRAQSKKFLNRHWAEFLKAQGDIRKGSLGAQEWDQRRQAIATVEAEIQRLRQQHRDVQRRLEKIQRLGRVKTMLPELRQVRQKLQQLTSVIILEDDEESRIQELIREHHNVKVDIVRNEKDVQQLRAKIEALIPDPKVTDQEAAIQKINQGLSQYETRRREELPRLYANKNQREDTIMFRIKELLGDAPSVHVDMLRIPFADIEYAKQIIGQIPEVIGKLRHQEERCQELQEQRSETQQRLHNIGPVEDVLTLRELVDEIHHDGNLDDLIAHAQASVRSQSQLIKQILARQSVYSGDLNTLERLVVPLDATVDRYYSEWETLRDQHYEHHRKRQQLEEKLAACNKELETLELLGHVPIESELIDMRRLRDQGWELLKRQWLNHSQDNGEDGILAYTQGLPLEEVFEKYLRQADDIADHLRLEADKSARRALLLLEKSQNEGQHEQVIRRLKEIRQEVDQFKQAWKAQWADAAIDVKTPAEMKEWLATVYRPVIQGLNTLRSYEKDLQKLISRRESFREELSKQTRKFDLILPDSGLKQQTLICESFVKDMEDRQRDAERLRQDLIMSDRRLEKEQTVLENFYQDLTRLERTWEEWAKQYPFLPEDYQIASLYIQQLEELFKWEREKQEIEREIGAKEAWCQAFEKDVIRVAEALNDPLTDFSLVAPWISHIRQRLETAKGIDTKRIQLNSQVAEQEEELAHLRQRSEDIGALLEESLIKCRCSTVDELLQQIDRSKAVKESRQIQQQLEQNIRQAGDGRPVDELEEEFAALEHPEDLNLMAEELRAEVDKLAGKLEEHNKTLRNMQMEFHLLSGDKTLAAEAAQKAEHHLAEIDRLWTEYLRVELARRLLQRAIENYRQQNESAIIDQASDFFCRLTLNHYTQLRVEYDNNIPYLEARHRKEGRRRVSQMSDGTRDQLYLALRLAFIAQHLAKSEPLPLIMDDILVHFDDDRTQATLEVLNELSNNTQILYFTHHQLVVDKALTLRSRPAQVHYLAQLV